ncbi:hypothetical protein HK405_010438, partial [Cladochytrium tenue]
MSFASLFGLGGGGETRRPPTPSGDATAAYIAGEPLPTPTVAFRPRLLAMGGPLSRSQPSSPSLPRSSSRSSTPSLSEATTAVPPPPLSPAVAAAVASVLRHKERGNDAHKKGNHSTAASEYTKALSYFESTSTAPPRRTSSLMGGGSSSSSRRSSASPPPVAVEPPAEPRPLAKDDPLALLATLLSNRSAAYLRDRKPGPAYLDAAEVARLRPEWVKGHYRMGEALMVLRRYEEALERFKMALERDPGSRVIMERISRANIHIKDLGMGLIIRQLQPGRDLCAKSLLAPIQNLIFDFAVQMQNFIYLVGNLTSREVVVVDPCWDIDGILKIAKHEGLTIVGAILTHYHIDHAGGIPPPPYDQWGVRVDGIATLLKRLPGIKAYVNPHDIDGLLLANPELPRDRLQPTTDGDLLVLPAAAGSFDPAAPLLRPDGQPAPAPEMRATPATAAAAASEYPARSSSSLSSAAEVEGGAPQPPPQQKPHPSPPPMPARGPAASRAQTVLQFLHTPGHTPGSQCVLVNGGTRLVSGDTLFVGSCGRVDLADSDPGCMAASLARLGGTNGGSGGGGSAASATAVAVGLALPDACVVLPGHSYGGEFTTVASERSAGLLNARARQRLLEAARAAAAEAAAAGRAPMAH